MVVELALERRRYMLESIGKRFFNFSSWKIPFVPRGTSQRGSRGSRHKLQIVDDTDEIKTID